MFVVCIFGREYVDTVNPHVQSSYSILRCCLVSSFTQRSNKGLWRHVLSRTQIEFYFQR